MTTKAKLEAALRGLLSRGHIYNEILSDIRNPVCFYCGDSQFYGDRHRPIHTYDEATKRYSEAPCPLVAARKAAAIV